MTRSDVCFARGSPDMMPVLYLIQTPEGDELTSQWSRALESASSLIILTNPTPHRSILTQSVEA
jgi:hypothetical protein